MQENAIYSVISPEGCAAILWRDAGEARKAAAAFKPDAAHCLELGVIDGIVPEPPGGAQNDWNEAARLLRSRFASALDELEGSRATSSSGGGGRSSAPWASSRSRVVPSAFPGIFHTLHRLFPGREPEFSTVSTCVSTHGRCDSLTREFGAERRGGRSAT